MSNFYQSKPPLDFRFLDLMIIILVAVSSVAILAILTASNEQLRFQVLSGKTPDAYVNHRYELQFFAIGGRPPYSWRASGVPTGLSVHGDGLLGGVPSTAGDYHVSLTATDQSSATATAEFVFHIAEGGTAQPPLHINTRALPTAYLGRVYNLTLAAEGGAPPYEWRVVGLPKGLSAAGPFLTGSPEQTGLANLRVEIFDSNQVHVQGDLDLQVVPSPGSSPNETPELKVESLLPPMVEGQSYSLQLCATGGIAPYQWKALSLQPGVTVSPSGHLLVEKPENLPHGWSMEVKAYDSSGHSVVGELFPLVLKKHLNLKWFTGIAVFTAWIVIIFLVRSLSFWALTVEPSTLVWRIITLCTVLGLIVSVVNSNVGVLVFLIMALFLSVLFLAERADSQ